ncbi:hypothetical protein AB0J71_33645 [Nonomuraea sp. NPDC049637]|uniref:hypothetical protein n=1 Tax=Nonomuraea sp. NPDC049637 TaxID=3154356 RepID=UPI0034330DD6
MLKRFIPAAVAAASLAGLAFASPANAEAMSDNTAYGCAAGDFCMYSTEVISAGTKIGIGRGEDYGPVSVANSQYKGVRSFFNNGTHDPYDYDYVLVTYVYSNGAEYSKCIPRALNGDLKRGHRTVDSPVTVTWIQWRREGCAK